MENKFFHIVTFGCQMNVYDSSRMEEVLINDGWQKVDSCENASLVIINTCHIREKAAEKVYSEIGRIKLIGERRKQVGGDMIIGVAGCVAQAQGEEIFKRASAVDLVFGPQVYHKLPQMLKELKEKGRILNLDFIVEDKFDELQTSVSSQSRIHNSAAFLSIQEGCDKFCTYCVVPYTRGAEFSRDAAKIIFEAMELVRNGALEITLLGQNVNAWHGLGNDGNIWDLSKLVAELSKIDGLERIRYTTSYPAEMSTDLINAHHDVAKLMPYLHLPIQSGSDKILKLMNRRHTADEYRNIINKLKAKRPDMAISSDFIVGFPQETDQDFQDTLNIVEEIGFIGAYSFKYSPRPGTPAATMEGQVSEEVKSKRLKILQDLLHEQNQKFNNNMVGKSQPVLFHGKGRKEGQLIGRTPYMQIVHAFAPEDLIGKITNVEITSAHPNSLGGEII